MAAPQTAGPRVRDIITPYRVLYTLALTAAFLLLVFGFQKSKDQSKTSCGTAPIVNLIPCPGDTDLRQGLIGASLTNGYQAALQVDGLEIPQDQLRTGGVNQLFFQPGPGTETGALVAGRHTATLIFWPVSSDRVHAQTFSWTFSST